MAQSATELRALVKPAGPGLAPLTVRAVAKLIDGVLYLPVLCAAGLLTILALGATLSSIPAAQGALEKSSRLTGWLGTTAAGASAGVLAIVAWAAVLGVVLYQWYLLATRGQTVGKRLCGIRIVTASGQPAGLVQALVLRNWVFNGLLVFSSGLVASVLPFAASLLFLLDYLPVFGADRRCLHDTFSGTQVRWVKAFELRGLRVVGALAAAAVVGLGVVGYQQRAVWAKWMPSPPAAATRPIAEAPTPAPAPPPAPAPVVPAPAPPKPADPPAAAPEPPGIYRYTDQSGVPTYVDDLSKVPAPFRSSAQRME